MTLEALYELLKTTGIAVVYRAWAGGEIPPLPWLCYFETSTDNFGADDRVYFPIQNAMIELYTEQKSPELESKVEAVLDGAGIFWDKTETYIDAQRCYQIAYQITM